MRDRGHDVVVVFETAQSANGQCSDVAVETVLAQQRACMPQPQMWSLRYRDPGRGGVERTTVTAQAGGGRES